MSLRFRVGGGVLPSAAGPAPSAVCLGGAHVDSSTGPLKGASFEAWQWSTRPLDPTMVTR